MIKSILAAALAAALAGAGTVSAQAGSSNFGASADSPGHKMQTKGSVSGHPGASGYAPGQRMQAKGSVKGTTGASGYAPGHRKTNTDVNARVRTRSGGATVGAGAHVR